MKLAPMMQVNEHKLIMIQVAMSEAVSLPVAENCLLQKPLLMQAMPQENISQKFLELLMLDVMLKVILLCVVSELHRYCQVEEQKQLLNQVVKLMISIKVGNQNLSAHHKPEKKHNKQLDCVTQVLLLTLKKVLNLQVDSMLKTQVPILVIKHKHLVLHWLT